jgi:hypothetical protein
MLERHGVILKGGVQIRLGQMPGISRFGKEAQVGDLKHFYQLLFLFEGFLEILGVKMRMDQKQESKKYYTAGDEGQVDGGFSHLVFIIISHRRTQTHTDK